MTTRPTPTRPAEYPPLPGLAGRSGERLPVRREARDEAQETAVASIGLGVSFLSAPEESEANAEPDEWQRYVEDRLSHFTTFR